MGVSFNRQVFFSTVSLCGLLLAVAVNGEQVTVNFNLSGVHPELGGVPVRVALAQVAARVGVSTTEINSDGSAVDPESVKITFNGSPIFVTFRMLPANVVEFVIPVSQQPTSCRISFEPVSVASGNSGKPPPAVARENWAFQNASYRLTFDPAGNPSFASAFDGQVAPLVKGRMPFVTTLQGLRVLRKDALGTDLEVTQYDPRTQVTLTSVYSCYNDLPYCLMERKSVAAKPLACQFGTAIEYMDRFDFIPGGTFNYQDSICAYGGDQGPQPFEKKWMAGSWGGNYTDAVSSGSNTGFGLYLFNLDHRPDRTVPGAICPGGEAAGGKDGFLCLIFSKVTLNANRPLQYRVALLTKRGGEAAIRTMGTVEQLMAVKQLPLRIERATATTASACPPALSAGLNPAQDVLTIKTADIEYCFNLRTPALEWMRAKNAGLHYRWDGMVDGDWTGYLLRIADTALPVGKRAGYIKTPETIPQTGREWYPVNAPYTIRWPGGATAVIDAIGNLQVRRFPPSGEISTLDFTGYQSGSTLRAEILAADMPEVGGSGVVMFNAQSGLKITSNLTITPELTDSGLTPSVERMVTLPGGNAEIRVQPSSRTKALVLPGVSDAVLSVALAKDPGSVFRHYPVKDTGWQGRKFKLGENPLPLEVQLTFNRKDGEDTATVGIDPAAAGFVKGISLYADGKPLPEITTYLPAGRDKKISLWVTFKEDVFGKYALPLLIKLRYRGETNLKLEVPVAVRLAPIFGTWVYKREWWEQPEDMPAHFETGFQERMYKTGAIVRPEYRKTFPRDLRLHRVNTIVYEIPFDEYLTTGELNLNYIKYGLQKFLEEKQNLIVTLGHHSVVFGWNEAKQGKRSPQNKAYVKFLTECYTKAIKEVDHQPNVIAWYLFDETFELDLQKKAYEICLNAGATRPVHSLLWLGEDEHKKKKNAQTDIWHCDPYANDLVPGWIDWSKTNFKDRMIFATFAGQDWGIAQLENIRKVAIRAAGNGLNAILYWMYLEQVETDFPLVYAGPHGVITSYRWEAVRQAGIDVEYIANIDYLLNTYANKLPGDIRSAAKQGRDAAVAAGIKGDFYQARMQLAAVWNKLVNHLHLSLVSPELDPME